MKGGQRAFRSGSDESRKPAAALQLGIRKRQQESRDRDN
jgi:hypothetical protein